MSDIFSPPPTQTVERAKPPLCGAVSDLGKCTLYRDHAAPFHRDQHKHTSWNDTPPAPKPERGEPRVWAHARKGEIRGHLIALSDDGAWATILLDGKQVHRTRFDVALDGEPLTVRASFLTPQPTHAEVTP